MAEYISFQPSDFFTPLIWTGTGASNAITGVGFQPDLVWAKQRSGTEYHEVCDSVRGATKIIYPNETAGEGTNAQTLKTFDAEGYTLGTSIGWNQNTGTYVGWNWKAGTTSGLSGGTITPSSYSINTTSGFGIYTYAGNGTSAATIAHGLGVVPKMIIIKRTETTAAWMVYHEGMGNTKYLSLDTLAAAGTSASAWNDTSPTSTLFSLGDGGNVNNGSGTYVAYAFANVPGYSKFGSYSSNASSNGPFVYTGFRPAFTLIKEAFGSNPWVIDDVKRETINEMEKPLKPNNTDGTYAGSAYGIDFLSNGFKIRNNDSTYNGSGNDFIYAAFAEFPIVSSNDVPTVAR